MKKHDKVEFTDDDGKRIIGIINHYGSAETREGVFVVYYVRTVNKLRDTDPLYRRPAPDLELIEAAYIPLLD